MSKLTEPELYWYSYSEFNPCQSPSIYFANSIFVEFIQLDLDENYEKKLNWISPPFNACCCLEERAKISQ